jgi:hypothetical protein
VLLPLPLQAGEEEGGAVRQWRRARGQRRGQVQARAQARALVLQLVWRGLLLRAWRLLPALPPSPPLLPAAARALGSRAGPAASSPPPRWET